ncbi:class I SAM-dependent methyltransferase [Candidatus Uabimicrobium sp. HlEnr_7]|uniref:class I SAM-dependent methyltransferase n=1 Tax=Candidatus Uabimicrobium helgolandensis TaxID=3095367 RepID=UPI0035567F5A
MKKVDFGLTSNDYVKHRAGFPQKFFDEIHKFDIGKERQEILDLGTGTGTLARGFAKQGAIVTGIDISKELIGQAKILDREQRLSIDYVVDKVEEMSFAPQSFDCIVAGQCWHWFDRQKVAKKSKSILKKGGQLVIAHFDWIPIDGNIVDKTEKLILKHNPSWHLSGGTGIYPDWFTDVAKAGFIDIQSYTFDLSIPYTHRGWRGRIRASAGIGASLEPQKVENFDQELQQMLAKFFPENTLRILHRVFTLICKKP